MQDIIQISDMTVDMIVKERTKLEYIVDNCKYETPEQICELMTAYTLLIWKHKQVGRVYDLYYDEMAIVEEGGGDVAGSDNVIKETLATLASVPNLGTVFCEIHCVGNPEDGFRFGQVVYNLASSENGISKYGKGPGKQFAPFQDLEMCECIMKNVDGKWRVFKEWAVRSLTGFESVLKKD
ncbi:hypothetical protein [Alkalibacter mobilis]|uniref:hypothetical protein n=1 Tax=Alkalibacter mobilis TaxID=2787712 RepID=UPI00189E632D|nr:hypothetical protein [Alkalibacter mobilis]MBF7096745.1 hypothetical protein [Alkalibacter mobilis]